MTALERTARARARRYRTRTGADRPPDPYPPAFLQHWRTLHRDAEISGAWTWLPSPSAVAALRGLAEHGEVGGMWLAGVIGVDQANLTARTLPRLLSADIVTSRQGEGRRGYTGNPLLWSLTPHGHRLVALLDPP